MAQTAGDIRLFAQDVEAYLVTLGLDTDERGEVKAYVAQLSAVASQSTDSPVPTVVDGWY